MGVEYCHGIAVRDLNWTPTRPAITNVMDVCATWGLAVTFDVLCESDHDRAGFAWTKSKIGIADTSTLPSDLPGNIVLTANPAPEGAAITRAIGPARTVDFPDESRYLMALKLIFGLDYQVFPRSETIFCESQALAIDAHGEPLTGRDWQAVDTTDLGAIEAFLSPPAIHPPAVSVSWNDSRDDNHYGGCFRSGMILDCGKNLLEGLDGPELLTTTEFVADVENAFGTELAQFGYYY